MSPHRMPRRVVPLLAVTALVATGVVATPTTPAQAAPAAPAATSCDAEAQGEGMEVAQQVDLPASKWNGVWNYDATPTLGAFDRVAYCLELGTAQKTQGVYTSMQAFTTDARRIGLPTAAGDIRRQRVSDLHVSSTAPGVPTGDHQQGYIEMWGTDFDPASSGQVPGASATTYDADDRPSATGTYGSFQVHAVGDDITSTTPPATVLAVNAWNNSSFTLDLGIGTSTTSNPDWTFAHNAAQYSTRRLTVYARPALVALEEAPQDLRLYPRGADGHGQVAVSGRATDAVRSLSLDLRATGETAWTSTPVPLAADRSFSASAAIPAELRNREARLVATTATGTRTVGHWHGLVAGTVVVLQGQSNAEAMGMSAADQATGSSHVSEWVRSFGSPEQNAVLSGAEQTWNYAQANVGSIGDKRWNAGHVGMWGLRMGADLSQETGMPVAVINGAKGGQVIEYFARNTADRADLSTNYGRLYTRMRNAGLLNRVDALMFYQGESDHDRADAHVQGFGRLLEGWTHDFARDAQASTIDYYAFQVRSSCAAAPVGITLREAQRTLPATFPDYRLTTLSTTGIPRHDGCHYPYDGGYDAIAREAEGVLLRDLFDHDGTGLSAPDPARVTGSPTSSVLELQLRDTTEPLRISGNPSGDFALAGSPARVTRVTNVGGGPLRLTLDAPLGAGATGLTYYGHVGTGPRITTTHDVGLYSFNTFPITQSGLPATTATLASLSVDGKSPTGFDPSTTTYEIPATAGTPTITATPTDPAAQVEVRTTPERIDIRVTAADGTTTTTYTLWLQRSEDCAVPAPWHSAGWGPAQNSSFCAVGSSSFVIGDGNQGMWTNYDTLSTVHQPDALGVGDGMDVRLASLGTEVNADSRAGIVVRNDLSRGAADSPSKGYATLAVSGRWGTFMQWDSTGDGWIDAESPKSAATSAPAFLRIVRETRGTLVGYARTSTSQDWTRIASVTLQGADDKLDVGVFTTANRAAGALESARFDGVTLWHAGAEPVVVGQPAIQGTPTPGSELTAVVPTTDPADATVSLQWLRDGHAIPGDTGATHTVTAQDSGTSLVLQVSAEAAGRTTATAVSDPVAVDTVPTTGIDWVGVTGDARPGSDLQAAATATPADAVVTYQWLRDGHAIQGATSATHTVTGGDAGHALSVRATATSPVAGQATVTSRTLDVSALLAAWSFDQASSGNTFADSSVGGRDATVPGTLVTGPVGGALETDGTSRGTLGGQGLSAALAGAPAVTVSGWIRPTALEQAGDTEGNWILGTRIDQARAGIDIGFVGSRLRVGARSVVADPYNTLLVDYPDDQQWHHVAVRIDYQAKTLGVWIDGKQRDAASGSTSATFQEAAYTPGTPTQADTIGASPAPGLGSFTGGLDELRIRAGALSEEDLRTEATPRAPGLEIRSDRDPDQGQWYRSAPTLTFPLAVPLQGLVGTEYRLDDGEWTPLGETPVDLPEGITTLEARSVVGEDRGTASVRTLHLDTQVPTVEVGITPEAGGTRARIEVRAEDATSGVALTEVSIDEGDWQPWTTAVEITGAGDHTIRARATDAAGNVSEILTRHVELTSDNDGPGPDPSPDPSPDPTDGGSQSGGDTPGTTPGGSTPTGPTHPGTQPSGSLARTGAGPALVLAGTLSLLLAGLGTTALRSSRAKRGGRR